MVTLSDCTFEILSIDADHTYRLGYLLGSLVQPGDIICLSGQLGAGKTSLTRGIGSAWGAAEAVTSPTFTLIHEHHRVSDQQVLYHVDCYRLSGPEEAWNIGLEDMLHDEGIVIMEWPEHVAAALPAERLWITLLIPDNHAQRQLTIRATGARYQQLCAAFRDHINSA